MLDGVPGACASLDEDAFTAALDALLALSTVERTRIRDALRARYGREAFLARMASLIRGLAR